LSVKVTARLATEQLKAAVDLYQQFTVALSDLGLQYMKLKEMDKAATTYETLLKLKPSQTIAHLNLGIALYNISVTLASEKKLDEVGQKLQQAEEHLRAALRLNSSGLSAHYLSGSNSHKAQTIS
jgi:lipoprotein NlpI